jgi:acetyl-CoA carboxylase biotin carboxyl carrier protein
MPPKSENSPEESAGKPWDINDLKELLHVLVGQEITEFEMEQGGVKIRIKRGNCHVVATPIPMNGVATSPAVILPPATPSPVPAPVAHAAAVSAGPEEASPAESVEGLHVIKSPIVGTFYAAPAPNAPPFVQLGDVIQVGQVVCIVEAMKLMNEIESDVAGEIVRSYVENGQPVEYGQSLFTIKPSHKR